MEKTTKTTWTDLLRIRERLDTLYRRTACADISRSELDMLVRSLRRHFPGEPLLLGRALRIRENAERP